MIVSHGIIISFGKDRQGTKLFTRIKFGKFFKDRTYLLKKNKNYFEPDSRITPKLEHPGLLTKLPRTKKLQPEDI